MKRARVSLNRFGIAHPHYLDNLRCSRGGIRL